MKHKSDKCQLFAECSDTKMGRKEAQSVSAAALPVFLTSTQCVPKDAVLLGGLGLDFLFNLGCEIH